MEEWDGGGGEEEQERKKREEWDGEGGKEEKERKERRGGRKRRRKADKLTTIFLTHIEHVML